ncbi:type III PLP-dependent enzyme [Streptomyces sp. NPDC056661]|uniref:type III PLP-dependent enzyme n=1 Tax=Streptomyces sp. NPDC056661 TaxID=3345898 RepID=UPI0036878EB8
MMIDLPKLVQQFGTPLYAYDLSEAREAAEGLRRNLPEGSGLYYSLKANPNPQVAAAFRRAGCFAEVSSVGELSSALAAGFLPDQCMYSGPAKSMSEIAVAVGSGVRRFSVESPADYQRVAKAAESNGVEAECLLRITAPARAGGAALRMTGGSSQFGHSLNSLEVDPRTFDALPGGRLVGLHFFTISNAASEAALIAEFAASISTAAMIRSEFGLPLRVLDLGGGFAAPFAAFGERAPYPNLVGDLESMLDDQLPGWRVGQPEVVFEAGRRLVATCGVLVCRVQDVKYSQGRRFVLLESGVNHLAGLSATGRLLKPRVDIAVIGQTAESDSVSDGEPATVVGPLCTPADVLTHAAAFPPVEPGHLVAVPNVGAYGLSASLIGFLSRPMPVEVVVTEEGAVSASRLDLSRSPVTGAAQERPERKEV